VHQTPDPVFDIGQSVRVTVLGPASPLLMATIVEMTGPAVRLNMSQALPTGTAVKIEAEDTLLLADVCFCDAAPDGVVVGVTVRHMLTALAELSRLGRALRGENALDAREQEHEPAATTHDHAEEKIAVRRTSRIMEE